MPRTVPGFLEAGAWELCIDRSTNLPCFQAAGWATLFLDNFFAHFAPVEKMILFRAVFAIFIVIFIYSST
jgi:hypothetical protein